MYALPEAIRDVEGTARQLAPFLPVSEQDLIRILGGGSSTSVWLARGLSVEAAEAIRQLGLPGIRVVKRPQRYYPQGSLAAHVVGIAGSDNQGLEGIEYYYDKILRGTPGRYAVERDATQKNIPGGASEFTPPEAGHDVVLTIDSVIQYIAETRIQAAVMETNSERGLVLVMDPNTGEILANAVYPTFDPNYFQDFSADRRRNVAITDQYEPGSTFKFVTAAASVDRAWPTTTASLTAAPTGKLAGDGFATLTAASLATFRSWKLWRDQTISPLPSFPQKWARSVFTPTFVNLALVPAQVLIFQARSAEWWRLLALPAKRCNGRTLGLAKE